MFRKFPEQWERLCWELSVVRIFLKPPLTAFFLLLNLLATKSASSCMWSASWVLTIFLEAFSSIIKDFAAIQVSTCVDCVQLFNSMVGIHISHDSSSHSFNPVHNCCWLLDHRRPCNCALCHILCYSVHPLYLHNSACLCVDRSLPKWCCHSHHCEEIQIQEKRKSRWQYQWPAERLPDHTKRMWTSP